jgi:uncharacterized membrane protein YccF (DUF307 family)
MSPVSLLLNVFWIVFGGLWMAVAWGIAAVVMAITIIGLPWPRAAPQHRVHAFPSAGVGVYTPASAMWARTLGDIGNVVGQCWRAGGWRSGTCCSVISRP